MEAMMPDSRDERTKSFAEKQHREVAAGEVLQTPAQDELSHRIRQKWAVDTHVIAAVLAELEQQLSLASLRLAFRDERPQGAALAVGRITGSLAGMPIDLLLIVHPDGEIYPLRRDPNAGDDQIQSASSSKMSVLTADKDQYETLILDLMGVE
jgi:hypothetical protein